jgi:hypothetical protein
MTEIINFDSLNIISVRVPARLAERGPAPGPQTPYLGRLKYVIAGDVTYTTSVVISENAVDVLGFSDVYTALQQYVATILGQERAPTLGSIYFTQTTVTVRLGNQRNALASPPSLRQTNSNLVKVPFSEISAAFSNLMITFVNNIDTQARTEVRPDPRQ